jgi:hypothetical protein
MPHSLPSSFIARLAHLLPLALLACFALLGCDTGGLGSDKAPVLKFQPEPPLFSFPKLRVGDAAMGADQSVQLQNIGEGNLVLVDFEANFNTDEFDLYYFVDAEADRQVNGIVGGQNSLGDRLVVEPGHSITFVLSYHPATEDVASGTFNFRTNDAKYARAEIDIVSEERAPEITVAPLDIDFGRVAVGSTTDPQDVTVTNIGQEVLMIDQLLLSGSGFTASIGDQDVTENPGVYVDPDGDGNPGLAPDASFVMQVRFANTLEGPAEGLLSIMSNDPESPTVVVKLNANGASPCIRVSPTGDDGLMFGGVPLNGGLQRAITIESCGGQPLRIESIAMTDDSDAAIALVAESVPELPALMPAMTLGMALPNRNIKLECKPTEASAYGGWVEVKSNDPVNPSVKVKVTCLGVLNACPRPAVATDTFNVSPLETVLLDATPSADEDGPGGKPVKYRWDVLEKPQGSSAHAVESLGNNPQQPYEGAANDDLGTPTARFFVDVVGRYTLQLFVTDNLDQEAPSENCPEPVATVTINAESNEDIHVEMSWHTPGDANETDTAGSDVDLHMLHPRGQRWSTNLDCYYANPNPDWGMVGEPSDNPSLDLDDINGAGPENITLDNPENTDDLGAPYKIGVDYYREESLSSFEGYGPSLVTIRIYLGGQLAWQNDVPKELQRTHDFWEVAQIIWGAEHRVRVIDRIN